MSKQGPNSNTKVQGKLRNREKVEELARVADLKAVMGSTQGRRFMYDLLFEKCGVMNVYPGADSGIYRHEGRRMMGAEIIIELQQKMAPLYMEMVNEHLIEQANEQKLRDAALTPTTEEEDPDA